MNPQDDIIAAIITPIGEGGISVIRVSGKDAIALVGKNFQGKHPLISAPARTVHLGYFVDANNNIIDEVLATVFKSPHSYTTEDTVEISCHGGLYISQRVFEVLLVSGARAAEPGEFTKRAFLNGRLDLSQAEAVADLIRSRSESAHKISIEQLEGKLSNKIIDIRSKIITLCGLLELELDFTEEGIQIYDRSQITNNIDEALSLLNAMVESYSYGKICREGVRVTIVGKPNVGKSSIFNYLLNNNRSIVTEIPGTTRDFIEESFVIDGMLFTLVDTAGMRDGVDIIETEGILRTDKKISESSIVLFTLNAKEGLAENDLKIFKKLKSYSNLRNRIIIVHNKIDLCDNFSPLDNEYEEFKQAPISAKTGHGVSALKKILFATATINSAGSSDSGITISNERHKSALLNSTRYLLVAREDLLSGKSTEFVAGSLRISTDFLSEIIGTVTSEDILNNIFSKFCIGK